MQTLRRNLIVGFFFIAVLGTLWHFVYRWSGENRLIGYLAPVNESTFEHMKLIFFPSLFYLPILLHSQKKKLPSILNTFAWGILAGTWFIPVFFYSYSGILGKSLMWLDIGCFYLAVFATCYTTYRLILSDRKQGHLGIWLLVLMAILFFFFTYHPMDIGIFRVP